MSTLEQIHRVEIPADHPEPLARAEEFFILNGYHRRTDAEELVFERGKPGAGWWANTMFELHTVLTCEAQDHHLRLRYRVDVKGQHLSQMERDYWARESQRLEKILAGRAELIDLRSIEQERADAALRKFRSTGVMLAIIAFLILSAALLLTEFF